MDGRANGKSLQKLIENVTGALDGGTPAPATPIANHFLQKDTEVPWDDPDQEPEIELGGNFKAMYGM